MSLILVASAIVLALVVVAAAVSVWLAHENSLLRVTDVENDNEDAIRRFLAVVDRAEHELLIHDDGDKTDGSLYDDEDTVEAVRERLRACPSLKMRCLLNSTRTSRWRLWARSAATAFRCDTSINGPSTTSTSRSPMAGRWRICPSTRRA